MHGVKKGSPYTNQSDIITSLSSCSSSWEFHGLLQCIWRLYGLFCLLYIHTVLSVHYFSLFLSFCVCFAMLPSSSCLVSPHACISTITSADVDPLHISTLFCHSLFDICAYNRISSLSFLMRQYAYNLVSCVGLCILLFHTIVFQHSFRFPFANNGPSLVLYVL
jgi:hypothetical protein